MKIGYFPKRHIKNNVSSFLEEHANKQPGKVAFFYVSSNTQRSETIRHESISYENFNNKAGKFASGLQDIGVKKGARIIVFAPISPKLYISIAALQRIGAIPVLLDSSSRTEQLGSIINNSQPSGIIAPSEWLHIFGNKLSIFDVKVQLSSNVKGTKKGVFQFDYSFCEL